MITTFCTTCRTVSAQCGPQLACVSCRARDLSLMRDELGDDILDPDYPIELVHEQLRGMGIDPEELGRQGVEFVERTKRELGR